MSAVALRPPQLVHCHEGYHVGPTERLTTRDEVVCAAVDAPAPVLVDDSSASSARLELSTAPFMPLETALIHASQSSDQLNSTSHLPRRRSPIVRIRKTPVTSRTSENGRTRPKLAYPRITVPLRGVPICRCRSGDLSGILSKGELHLQALQLRRSGISDLAAALDI